MGFVYYVYEFCGNTESLLGGGDEMSSISIFSAVLRLQKPVLAGVALVSCIKCGERFLSRHVETVFNRVYFSCVETTSTTV